MTPEANFIILKSLAAHARFLADPSLNGGLPNMVIVESTGLVELALVLPEFADAALWRERGFEVLEAEMTRRVLPDGAWEEATPGYHGWVAHSCCELAALTKLNGVDLPDSVLSRFRAMYDWLLLISKPNGHSPMLGDANDGSIAGRMAEAALQFEAPDYRWFGPGTPPVALLSWYGADTMQRYTALAKREPQTRSTLLPDSGLAVMRTGWHSHDSYLLFDFGPIWSHTHQDTLGFSLHALGQTLLWDSGVSNYDMPECSGYYRQARAHNVVLIDDADMKLGPERPRLLAWKTTPAFDLVDAETGLRLCGPRAVRPLWLQHHGRREEGPGCVLPLYRRALLPFSTGTPQSNQDALPPVPALRVPTGRAWRPARGVFVLAASEGADPGHLEAPTRWLAV